MNDDSLLPDEALSRIDTLVAAVDRAESAEIEYDDSIRIHFLRNFTVEPIEPYLKFHVLREAIKPIISYGGYDTVLQEVLDPQSSLRVDSPEIVVLSLELTMLGQEYARHDWSADQAIDRLKEMFEGLRENTTALLVVNTMMSSFVSIEKFAAGQYRTDREVAHVNQWIRQYAGSNQGRFVVADWDHFLRLTGKDKAIDHRYWRLSMAPFKAPLLDLYAREIMKVARALKGKAKKCLVLDCDNTLWGGVIGEDGLDDIKLGTDEWPDKAYYEFQRSVLRLHERGVIITLCSKNNEEEVWEAMENHPDCLLKKSHLSAWRINWDNKASNIDALSGELNLPLDSFVCVDDSPRECQLIREALPQVKVLQVPKSLDEYSSLLLKDGFFDTLSVSEEDRNRTALYRAEAERSQGHQVHIDLDDYLASLSQTLDIWEATEEDRPRIAQLTQKTNQFNLTTRRYSEGQITEFMSDDDVAVLTMSVSDRYGDLGTTGVLIARRCDDIGHIDSLLLSCRVLGRKLEYAFVDRCLSLLEGRWKLSSWKAEYRPTKKNAQVVDFWDRVGFSLHADSGSMKFYSLVAGRRGNGYNHVVSIVEARIDAGTN